MGTLDTSTTLPVAYTTTLYSPPPVEVDNAEESRLVRQFLYLLRQAKSGSILTLLKEQDKFRWWANGQPAGVMRLE